MCLQANMNPSVTNHPEQDQNMTSLRQGGSPLQENQKLLIFEEYTPLLAVGIRSKTKNSAATPTYL